MIKYSVNQEYTAHSLHRITPETYSKPNHIMQMLEEGEKVFCEQSIAEPRNIS